MGKTIVYATCIGLVAAFGVLAYEMRALAHRPDANPLCKTVAQVASDYAAQGATSFEATVANRLRDEVDAWLHEIGRPLHAEGYLVTVTGSGGIVMSVKGGAICKGMRGVGGPAGAMDALVDRLFGKDHTI